jgi:hypothetical protein
MNSLHTRIAEIYKKPVEVHLHENSSIYLRAQRRGGILCLHMHRFFIEAPTPVLEAVLVFARKRDRGALRTIRKMAELYFEQNPQKPVALQSKGLVYDLDLIYERVKAHYFSPEYEASIGWSNRVRLKKFRSITYGTYDRQRRQIRINRFLDRAEVPLYFVEFVVYHEMLHAICPPVTDAVGRTRIHTREFKEKERQFAQYKLAKKWGGTCGRS